MRRVLFTTISLLALTASAAVAADLPRQMPPARAPAIFMPAYSWTGFYAGINGGYAWGDSRWDTIATSVDTSGWLVGGTLGYNWQTGALVFGLEGDIQWSDIRGTFANAACPAGCETRTNWFGTFRGRLGYAFDRFMPYFTGGLAFGDVEAKPVGTAGVSDTNVGWTIGGGIEAAVAPNWTAKLEYLYVDLGDVGCTLAACGGVVNVDHRFSVIRAGLNLRF